MVENTTFWRKKGKLPSEKSVLAWFLSCYRTWQKSGNNLLGSISSSDIYCGRYKITSVTPKRLLKTKKIEKKKTIFPMEKRFWPTFSDYRMWQTSGDNLQWSTRFSDNYCGSYKIIPLTSRSLLKTQSFEKKANFPVKKIFWPGFSRIIVRTNVREQLSRVHKVFWHLLWKLEDNFCNS